MAVYPARSYREYGEAQSVEQSGVKEERSRENEMRRQRSIDQPAIYDSFFVKDQRICFPSFPKPCVFTASANGYTAVLMTLG